MASETEERLAYRISAVEACLWVIFGALVRSGAVSREVLEKYFALQINGITRLRAAAIEDGTNLFPEADSHILLLTRMRDALQYFERAKNAEDELKQLQHFIALPVANETKN